MTSFRNRIRTAATQVEAQVARAGRVFNRGDPDVLEIKSYHGHGTQERLFLSGRVVRHRGVREAGADTGRGANLLNTARRVLNVPVAGVGVQVTLQDRAWAGETDEEGYFDLEVDLPEPLPTDRVWHEVAVQMTGAHARNRGQTRATLRVLVPLPDADFGVISDIDDTVVRTDVTNWLQMVRIVLFTNAHTRLPFPHVDALYKALQAGPTGRGMNPVFYVSSGPWNFYDLLEEFFRAHGIPEGPIFLKDYDPSLKELLGGGHHEHKMGLISMLFATHPELPWVLIGDSGQEDAEIYREVVRENPGRVRAVYIRDVTAEGRARDVHAIREEVEALGTPMRLVRNKTEAAEHAAGEGLIAPGAHPSLWAGA
jgi:phosphatidate phosphatase APP1